MIAINVETKANLSVFKNELSIKFNTNPEKITYLFSLNMEPAELYLTLSIADISGNPVS